MAPIRSKPHNPIPIPLVPTILPPTLIIRTIPAPLDRQAPETVLPPTRVIRAVAPPDPLLLAQRRRPVTPVVAAVGTQVPVVVHVAEPHAPAGELARPVPQTAPQGVARVAFARDVVAAVPLLARVLGAVAGVAARLAGVVAAGRRADVVGAEFGAFAVFDSSCCAVGCGAGVWVLGLVVVRGRGFFCWIGTRERRATNDRGRT